MIRKQAIEFLKITFGLLFKVFILLSYHELTLEPLERGIKG